MKRVDLHIQSKDNASFQTFLISEYNNIAEAHFTTVNTISSFFRYFLLIITIPIPIVVFLFHQLENQKAEGTQSVINSYASLASIGSITIFIVGLCVVIYIINLRFDALLYARTVNGVRRYFYDLSETDIFGLNKIKVLPVTPDGHPKSPTHGHFKIPHLNSFKM